MSMKRREKVITIHGVNPDSWQEAAHAVLAPHFECVAVKYDGYHGLQGPVRLVCHPFAVALVGVSAIGGVAAAWLGAWPFAIACFIVALVALGVGVNLARLQRQRRASLTKADFSVAAVSGRPPHVIAHSSGTYLTARAMRHADLSLGRVVLVGSPLPRDFDWAALWRGGSAPAPYDAVRNEVGTGDTVVKLTGWTRWLTRELGDAGRRGFRPGPRTHDLAGPWAGCPICNGADAGVVHNVPLNDMGHSDVFLGPTHAKRLWLPFLWSFPPGEFSMYLALCLKADFYSHEGMNHELGTALETLARSSWTWTDRTTTHAFVARMITEAPSAPSTEGGSDALARDALLRLCHFVADADDEESSSEVRRLLHPHWAMMAAVQASLAERAN